MGLGLDCRDGQTPLSGTELEDLLVDTISTRGELDEFEQQNIELAIEWSLKRNFTADEILTESFLCDVHKRMFSYVWKWVGTYRRTNKNIGVDKYQISSELNILLGDCTYWIGNASFPADEIAIRFKHRLVKIHLFPNGNGRHARLCADIMISHVFKRQVFSWGRLNLGEVSNSRKKYLEAIYQADQGEVKPLIEFARS